MQPTSLIEAIIQKTDNRYLAKSRIIGIRWGVVTTGPGKDPLKLDRIKVWMPPWPEGKQSDWIEMLSLGQGNKCGIFFPPHIDDEVMLLSFQGDVHRMFYLTHSSKNNHETPDDHYVRDIPEQRWMIRTQDGHKIEIFDDKLEQQIKLTTEGKAYVWLDDVMGQRKIELKDHIQQYMIFDVEKKEIEIRDWAGNHGLFVGRPGEERIELHDKSGNIVWLNAVSGQEKIEIKDKSGNYGLWNAVAGNEKIELKHGQKNSFLKLLPSGNVILNAENRLILSGKEVSIWPTSVLRYRIPKDRYICKESGTDYEQPAIRPKVTITCSGENLTE